MDISYQILAKIDGYFRNIASVQHNELIGDAGHQYCHTPISFFSEALNLMKKREKTLNNKKFIDAGCGLGCLCEVARLNGLNAEGIELIPILCDLSKQIFPEIKIHNMNVMDFNKYGEFDIIYYWLPFRNPELQQIFKLKIEDETRIGSYIVMYEEEEKQECGKDDRFISIDTNDIKNQVWQKIKA